MKSFKIYILLLFVLFSSCSKKNSSSDYIKKVSGRYLYSSDEIMEVFFENNEMFIKWRGASNIKPLLVDENTYFVKELNEKIQFNTNSKNNKIYISLVPKSETKQLAYNYMKLDTMVRVPSEYLLEKKFDKALEGYLKIKKIDSLDPVINEESFNRLGYKELRNKNIEFAVEIFKINVALYPNSPNVYDSLGEAFMKNGDTVKAIENYKKSLSLDSGNRRAKEQLKKLEKKE
ncbi:lipopolysaccharide assembly protein LapB [Lutibacter sp.]|uniref:tetratricopeptide repeat protein n=1 Tax=Lutibacter sp. TaxID=1925666 RepID=UPI002736D56A|nr:tetratricopeptide repeat protein [Lutibacter sp.]MDP3312093.1 tetratricopeptide repeat protein [Lutibacter sp.]